MTPSRPPLSLLEMPTRKRVDWAVWTTHKECPAGIVSFYCDVNVEGLYIGGGFWRFEGYLNLTLRAVA